MREKFRRCRRCDSDCTVECLLKKERLRRAVRESLGLEPSERVEVRR